MGCTTIYMLGDEEEDGHAYTGQFVQNVFQDMRFIFRVIRTRSSNEKANICRYDYKERFDLGTVYE